MGIVPLHTELYWNPGAQAAPLLLLHGGGSTIESNWGRLLPLVMPTRTVVAVELQGHGRTQAGDRPPSFRASADDVVAALDGLDLGRVDVLGFSNGGQVGMQLAARHPGLVRRLVLASAPFRRSGMAPGFWEGLQAGTFEDMPAEYVEADLAASGDPAHARAMFELDRALMLGFQDFPDALVGGITAPTLVVAGDQDVVTVPHAVDLAGLLLRSRLLVVPGNHGDYLGEVASSADDHRLRLVLPLLLDFLDTP
jgi:pimeloyl-ACP methyl ester carboxylesterase